MCNAASPAASSAASPAATPVASPAGPVSEMTRRRRSSSNVQASWTSTSATARSARRQHQFDPANGSHPRRIGVAGVRASLVVTHRAATGQLRAPRKMLGAPSVDRSMGVQGQWTQRTVGSDECRMVVHKHAAVIGVGGGGPSRAAPAVTLQGLTADQNRPSKLLQIWTIWTRSLDCWRSCQYIQRQLELRPPNGSW